MSRIGKRFSSGQNRSGAEDAEAILRPSSRRVRLGLEMAEMRRTAPGVVVFTSPRPRLHSPGPSKRRTPSLEAVIVVLARRCPRIHPLAAVAQESTWAAQAETRPRVPIPSFQLPHLAPSIPETPLALQQAMNIRLQPYQRTQQSLINNTKTAQNASSRRSGAAQSDQLATNPHLAPILP